VSIAKEVNVHMYADQDAAYSLHLEENQERKMMKLYPPLQS